MQRNSIDVYVPAHIAPPVSVFAAGSAMDFEGGVVVGWSWAIVGAAGAGAVRYGQLPRSMRRIKGSLG